MDTANVPRRCTNWCYCRSISSSETVEPKVEAATTAPPVSVACKKLDGVAVWLLHGVAAVFFKTLERCSCIYVGTIDDNNPDGDADADADVPFIDKNNADLQKHNMEEEKKEEDEGDVPLKNDIGSQNIKIDA